MTRTARPYVTLHGERAYLLEGGGVPARQVAAPSEEAAREIDAIRTEMARAIAEAEARIGRIRRGEGTGYVEMAMQNAPAVEARMKEADRLDVEAGVACPRCGEACRHGIHQDVWICDACDLVGQPNREAEEGPSHD